MLTENQKIWVDALRSGRFQQGRGQLEQVDGDGNKYYCCLGVACIIAAENGISVETYDGHLEGLDLAGHDEVLDWLGLSQESGMYHKSDDRESFLTNDNDGCGENEAKTFEQIADIIESEPKGLFRTV